MSNSPDSKNPPPDKTDSRSKARYGNLREAEARIEVAAAKEAKGLSLSGLNLIKLPESVSQLPHLTDLDVGGNSLVELPESIGRLKKLERLWAYGNNLTVLPDSLADLNQLRELSLVANRLRALPKTLGRLDRLESLLVQHNELTSLPESLSQLKRAAAIEPAAWSFGESQIMKRFVQRIVCALLLFALCTTALAQGDSFTTRIPATIAIGDFAEAKVLIEEAVKIGVITAAAEYRAQIQAQEQARRQQAQERSASTQQAKPQQAGDVNLAPKTDTQPSFKRRLGPDGIPLPYEPDADPDKSREKPGRIYVTYTKFNNGTKRFYSGRASMVVDLNKPYRPQAVRAVEQRDKNHHIEDENPEPKDSAFDPARLDEFDVGTAVNYNDRYRDLAYWRIRGREQQLIDRFGGAWSDTGEPYKTENPYRGVAKDNVNGRRFYNTATDKWGKLSEYTGD
ncbi:leucine-rich repeat domain-containing protein [Hyalangium versicolor]|uniref:leucine-rich repeat domain-containing protein n=1 Tax=Hyalangium versicolor TaxID=2861190 RepID=UPI001CCB5196|nr:leucine-rich repeat domain-containing protein [Hyalangium versicolor]